MTNTYDIFFSLIRLGIGTRSNHDSRLMSHGSDSVDWNVIKTLADEQGLTAVVLDGINSINDSTVQSLPRIEKLQWIGEVDYNYERYYETYKDAISSLAAFYNQHGYKMMVLKGYACSLDWPKPNHRPCGDIDIWLFGKQKDADAVIANEKGTKIDASHHHHTVFCWDDFTVENHFDFLNVHHHKSNVELEAILKDLASDTSKVKSVELKGGKKNDCGDKEDDAVVCLPSANLHALFLLRHSMSNFASTGMRLRQLLDWAFLVEKHGKEIDWKWLEELLEKYGMKKLYNIFNAICVEDLGFNPVIFNNKVQFLPSLKDRVLNDILSPEFSKKEKGGIVCRAIFKYRRWRANAWKHELCFNESMNSALWSGVKGHLLKPSSI